MSRPCLALASTRPLFLALPTGTPRFISATISVLCVARQGLGNGLDLVPTDQVLVNAAGVAEREGEEITEGEVLEAPVEEVDPRKHLPSPTMPSASAVAQHRETIYLMLVGATDVWKVAAKNLDTRLLTLVPVKLLQWRLTTCLSTIRVCSPVKNLRCVVMLLNTVSRSWW